jgi:glucose-6-phosphate 1-dehydrogenase
MQTWKFLLYGITGDLSKKKILPALAQFAELNHEKVNIELIGYSRSMPDKDLVKQLLDSNTTTGSTVITNIQYLQGDYADSKVFFDFIGGLKENERLVTYLAIPPELFLSILKNSCPFSTREIDLIIEKPFGRDLNEAQQMLKVMEACDLHQRIHFSDHYLFKTSTFVSKPEWSNFDEIKSKKIKKITLQALENIGVKDRGGYYDQIGALKDIFVHLFSLLNLSLQSFQIGTDNIYNSFKVTGLELGQYKSYSEDVQIPNSQANTYFKVDSTLATSDSEIEVVFESGKKLGLKKTAIVTEYEDGSKLNWDVAPENKIEAISDNSEKSIGLAKNNKQDHTNLFEMLLDRNMSRFVDSKDIVTSWEMFDKISEFKENQNIEIKKYTDDTYPPEFLN